jgi:predicted methyltransferase
VRSRPWLWLSLAAACKAGATAPATPPEPEPAAALVSVRPGVNDPYFEDDLAVSAGRLEAATREVFARRQDIVDALALRPGMTVADVGAGTGVFLAPLSAGVGPAGRVYATDIAPKMLERLRGRVAEEGLANVTVVEATAVDPRLPRGSLDLAFLCDVYHHIEYPPSTLAALRDALRPGAELWVVDFERIEGVTSPRMLAHVRAGKETVIEEIRAAGFVLVGEVELELSENYVLRFRGP